MNVLIWIPPWPSQGDFFFHQNSVLKHLFPQAATLLESGFEVDIVLPVTFRSIRSKAPFAAKVIEIGLKEIFQVFPAIETLDEHLYANTDTALHKRLCTVLAGRLRKNYDAILLWETPVPFMTRLFPEALIVHQMPGVFARPPYPHLVTFDASGLFKDSVLCRDAKRIIAGTQQPKLSSVADTFSAEMRRAFADVQPFNSETLNPNCKFSKLALLPLQVSNHYSFRTDAGFQSQSGLLSTVMEMTPKTTGVVVTQYSSRLVADTILDEDKASALKEQWPNLVFHSSFDKIPSSSQHLLPFMDEVFSCSSSLAMQAQIWCRPVTILGETHYQPFSQERITASGASLTDAYRNTLGFILGQHQPLSEAVVSDRVFLSSILEEMIARKRAGRTGIDLQPEFISIDPKYNDRLLGGTRVSAARKSLPSAEITESVDRQVSRFLKLARRPDVKAITFDVFDTLVSRPTETPADVFMFLERIALELSDGLTEDFARVRLTAEVSTREQSKAGEITLRAIYSYIQEFYRLSDDLTDLLMAREISLEVSFVEPRNVGIEMWKAAKELGKPLHIISDMYLPEEAILAILEKCCVTGFERLFVSSSYGVRKKEGPLFDLVLGEIGLDGSAVLHVGDNKEADEVQAKNRGMQTFRVARALDHMRSNPFFKEIYSPSSGGRELARSAVAGLTARRLFDLPKPKDVDPSHFAGRNFNLGFAGLGPLLVGYVMWLERAARRDGVSRLYFLSREGKIFQDVYEILFADKQDRIPSTYLYASRRTARVAGLRSRSDILALAAEPYRAGVTVGDLLNDRFSLRYELVPEQERLAYGFANPHQQLTGERAEKVAFIELCSDLSDRILKRASVERSSYLEYLETAGITLERRPAVVDIGWRANVQGALGRLLDRSLLGYYLATLQGADIWTQKGHRVSGYLGDYLSQSNPSACVQNRHVLEFLICHRDPSLLYFEKTANGVKPVFQAEDNHGRRSTFIDELHSGVKQFAKEFDRSFSFVRDNIWIEPSFAERAFASFINGPTPLDAELLRGFHFEDSVGGVACQFIVAPPGKTAVAASVWKNGANVLYPPKPVPRDRAKNVLPDTSKAEPTAATASEKPESQKESGILKAESAVMRIFIRGKKLAKYDRDRKAFFDDCQNPMLRAWGRATRTSG